MQNEKYKRILSIDGGGIRGVFPAAFLAEIEDNTGKRIVDNFDLIGGTSTGGIIALGLGLGIPAKAILEFYEEYGPTIFGQEPINTDSLDEVIEHRITKALRGLGHLFGSKYKTEPLKQSLNEILKGRKLGSVDKGDSQTA